MNLRTISTRLVLVATLCGAGLWSGCSAKTLDEERIWYPTYWGRHISKVSRDFHAFRIDVDRTVFGLEDVPVEKW